MAELLEETRCKCQRLELEVEKRQLEAQDGWAAAAQLQQYFTNLHNLLKSPTDEETEVADEPSELAKLVSSGIVSLKDEYQKLQVANAKNKEIILQLSSKLSFMDIEMGRILNAYYFPEQLADYEKEQQTRRFNEASESSSQASEISYLKDEIAILTLQLKQ